MCIEMDQYPMDVQVGWLCKSKAGHDKNQIYVIVDVKSNCLVVADGRLKTVENPKKKNYKHVQIIKVQAKDLIQKQQTTLRNEDIIYALRLYNHSVE